MEHERQAAWRKLVLALDAALVLVAMVLAAALHPVLRQLVPAVRGTPAFSEFALVAYLALPIFLGWLVALGAHRTLEQAPGAGRIAWQLLRVHALVLVSLALAAFTTQATVNRSLVGLFLLSSFALLFAGKTLLARWRRFQYAAGTGRARWLVVGAPSEALDDFVRDASRSPLPVEFVGRLDDGAPLPSASPVLRVSGSEALQPQPQASPDSLRLLGPVSSLEALLQREPIDRVLFFAPYARPALVQPALEACETVGVPASFIVELERSAHARPTLAYLSEQPFVTFDVAPKRPELLALKHVFDWVAAALGLLVLSPLLVAIALAVLVTMGRPVLFVQERAGLFGRRFRMLKFRTMVRDAEAQKASLEAHNEMGGPVFKMTADPRVTRLGALLRKTSLDELPQLLNVLGGSMSLVGPRPLPLAEQEGIAGWHRRRLSMKPGLTCLWQVSGRSNIDFEGWMRLDLQYVDEWSPLLDLKLLVLTVPAVLFGRGAR